MRRNMRPGRHLAWVLFGPLAALAHVPTYEAGTDNCFTPPHHHDTSQVIYLKGSGGLEIHYKGDKEPFDFSGHIDFDAVFKEEYDQSTYALYVGCGGCVASVDPIVLPKPTVIDAYQEATIEPFTMTRYYSVFKKGERRKFDADLLRPGSCDQEHWGIRLVDFHNRTTEGHDTLIWGAVVGLGENFQWYELISFPSYILRNHGEAWNQLGWTYPVILPLVLLGFFGERWARRPFGQWIYDSMNRGDSIFKNSRFRWSRNRFDDLSVFKKDAAGGAMIANPRAWCCEFAIVAFIASALEEFVHLMYAQWGAPLGGGFWVCLFLVILLCNGVPIGVQLWIYSRTVYRRPTPLRDADLHWCRDVTHPNWFWAELLLGLGQLYLFLGAGFYLGPGFVILDSLFRAAEALGWERPYVATWRGPNWEGLILGGALGCLGLTYIWIGVFWSSLWGGASVNAWLIAIGGAQVLLGLAAFAWDTCVRGEARNKYEPLPLEDTSWPYEFAPATLEETPTSARSRVWELPPLPGRFV
tara:strand:- start:356 stop:1933 length:1578 start_codon:yes stop_codon:yes gene_type:complete